MTYAAAHARCPGCGLVVAHEEWQNSEAAKHGAPFLCPVCRWRMSTTGRMGW